MNGLYLAASGAASTLGGLSSVADNLANLSTPGFRRLLNDVESVTGGGTPYQYAMGSQNPVIDTSQGALRATNNPLDIAITGSAFLNVQTPNGDLYTRNGTLGVSPDGTLTAAGYPVLNPAGGTIQIKEPGTLVVGGDGSVSLNGTPVGQIAMVEAAGTQMAPLGASLYRTANGEILPPATSSQIHQGFLEGSTGSEITEVTSMLGMMRSYESSMKAVHEIDNGQSQAIQALTLRA
jgi:flagellar basal-body rod protein FlgF